MGHLLESTGSLCGASLRRHAAAIRTGRALATAWMDRVLPRMVELARHAPERTVFTRFIPPRQSMTRAGYGELTTRNGNA